MSAPKPQPEATAIAAPLTLSQRLAQWIDDPFASVIVGTVAPAVAVVFVFSGISGLALLH